MVVAYTPCAMEHLLATTAPADQVEDQDYQGDNNQDVDKAATDMKGEPEQPQNDKNYEDCPKHLHILADGHLEY